MLIPYEAIRSPFYQILKSSFPEKSLQFAAFNKYANKNAAQNLHSHGTHLIIGIFINNTQDTVRNDGK